MRIKDVLKKDTDRTNDLATLKREHAQLRAAAKLSLRQLESDYGKGPSGHVCPAIRALRAALDATPAEPQTYPAPDLVLAVRDALDKLYHRNVWAIEDARKTLENALSKQASDLDPEKS